MNMNVNEIPTITTPSRQLKHAEAIAFFRNAKPLPANPRKEAKLRSAITKLKMESEWNESLNEFRKTNRIYKENQ